MPVSLGKRIGGVHLRKLHVMLLQLAPQQGRVFVEGHMRLITQPVNPAHAIDQSALDVMHAILVSPVEAPFK